MKQLLKLLPILLIFSCTGDDVDLQSYYEMRENDFLVSGEVIDLEEVIEELSSLGKPILFYFNCYACVNSRKMEVHVLGDRKIAKTIVKKFLLVPVVVDDKTQIPETQGQKSKLTGKMMRSVGNVNSDLQVEIAQSGSQPYFAVMNTDKEIMGKMSYTRSKKEFMDFLKSSIKP